MQGDSSPAVRRKPVVTVLVVTHVVVALVVVLAVSRVGALVAEVVGQDARIALLLAAAAGLAATDVVAIVRGRMAIGLRRQTPKSVADDGGRPWWVVPVVWGGDTGVIGSTFRVSSTSWILLVAALLGLAPWWAGAIYGIAFAVPLAALIRTGEGAPLCQVRPRRGRMAIRAVQSLGVVLLVGPALLAAACTGPVAAPACADRVVPAEDVPAARRERLAAHGITAIVGGGEVAFVAPMGRRWSELVDERSDGAVAKVALWVDRAGPVPTPTVRREGSDDRGTAAPSVTTEGLPGPVPTTVSLPGRGCWVVTAEGADGRPAVIRFAVR